ncbi:FAD-dependent oxidoreductase [Aquincola sp. MAHUQ-54]|uniref:FAD-dependent oxidoreductase n=1 Tax=Aquincola agrisoli TaxID=3119538 RepID=A0AAW9Q804_9BURK
MSEPIVIVGGGHAAAQLCASLAEAGLGARVHLVCEERRLPYHRPPLSKGFLKHPEDEPQPLRPDAWYADSGITLHLGDAAVSIDRGRRTLRLASGAELGYGQLVLATGTRARRPLHLADGLANVMVLRSADDAVQLRERLAAAPRLTVLGGGFIGLEIAATARAMGKEVVVIESAPRLMMRAVSPEVSQHVLQTHRAAGIEVRLGASAGHFEVDGDRLAALDVSGTRTPVELLVLGIGAAPEHALATAAGLECDNGIVVDAFMRTSDPAILAIGDCASFPQAASGRRMRLEAVQNALDQARTAAATLAGQPRLHDALPWFWSEQGSLRLQMAGLVPAPDAPGVELHRRPGASDASFSLLHYAGGRLVCVESVNAPLDHMPLRKLLEAGRSLSPAEACDTAVPLKKYLAG